ncbi:hypothetical protein TNCV_3778361, partial [Trichonephila clavipes]
RDSNQRPEEVQSNALPTPAIGTRSKLMRVAT